MLLAGRTLLLAVFAVLFLNSPAARGEVKDADSDGFVVVVSRATRQDRATAFEKMVGNVGKWWGDDHTYGLDGSRVAFDLERRCMFERLKDGGFVRHMEIVCYQPGQRMVLSGGLGPLQPMGVYGAWTIEVKDAEGGGADIVWRYEVSGARRHKLDKLAPAVNAMLNGQLQQLTKFLDDL